MLAALQARHSCPPACPPTMSRLQVEKEVQKAISLMEAVDVQINKKKEVSRKVGAAARAGRRGAEQQRQ